MSGRPWYKRYPRDFLDGITGLGPDLIGAYCVVLDLMYARGGPIPNDNRWLAGILGCSPRAATSLIERLKQAGKLSETSGQLTNERVENQLESDAKISRNLRESGAKGGRTRAERDADARKTNHLGQARLKHTCATDTDTDKKEAKLLDHGTLPRDASRDGSAGSDASPTGKQGQDAAPRPAQTPLAALCEEVRKAARMVEPPGDTQFPAGWLRDGIDVEEVILPAVTKVADRETGRGKSVRTYRYLDGAVREAHAAATAVADAETARLKAIAEKYPDRNPAWEARQRAAALESSERHPRANGRRPLDERIAHDA